MKKGRDEVTRLKSLNMIIYQCSAPKHLLTNHSQFLNKSVNNHGTIWTEIFLHSLKIGLFPSAE